MGSREKETKGRQLFQYDFFCKREQKGEVEADRVVSQTAAFLKIGEMTAYFYADGNNTVQKKIIMKIEGGITEVISLCA